MANPEVSESDWQDCLNNILYKAEKSGDVNRVKQAKSLKEKVEICYNLDYIYNDLKKWLKLCLQRPNITKKSSIAEQFRLKGNKCVQNNDKLLALKCYNKSLFYAPKDSDELLLAYGNRSFILMEMHHNSECVKDVDRALIGDQSSLRQLKLLTRKGQALIALAKYSEATEILKKALSLRKNFTDELQRKSKKVSDEIVLMLSKIINESDKENEVNYAHCNDLVRESDLNFEENPTFRSASKNISLVSNERKGRYVIANENIKVGDVLFAERPFAFVVLPEMADKYCSYCCKAVYIPVPCENCPLACFCNETCRDLAVECFHKWECGGLELCYSIGIVHLALRVALLGLLDKNKEKYKEMTNLVSHVNDCSASDLFNYAVTATLLTVYLEDYSKLFDGTKKKEQLLDFGGILLLHIAQLICNGHAITDIESECDPASNLLIENQIRVATAIYPSASMMNHSCDPSIINSFFESLLIVRAAKDLSKGEEVYNCYGPMVQKMNYEDRQELLSTQYMFTCECDGCLKKLGPVSDNIICESCSALLMVGQDACTKCSKKVDTASLKSDLKGANIHFKDGLELLNNGEYRESCEYFEKSLSLYQKHCHKNHQKILESRDCLARANANMGRDEEACRYITQNISCIEDMYGKTAVEVGQEILKLITVATNLTNRSEKQCSKNRQVLENCIKLGQKGKFILELSYGDWHPRYKEFSKHLDYLSLCIGV